MSDNMGSLPSHVIRDFINQDYIAGKTKIDEKAIQPASLDLTLGTRGWRLRGSLMPQKGEKMIDLIQPYVLYDLDLTKPVILEKGGVYLIELNESLNLPADITACTEGKSSTGRVDLQTRLVVDGYSRFDNAPAGYQGPLYIEVIPRSFIVQVGKGLPLNQLRLFRGKNELLEKDLAFLHDKVGILYDPNGNKFDQEDIHFDHNGIMLSVDLDQDQVGFRARNTNRVLDMLQVGELDPEDFFEPIPKTKDGTIILKHNEFNILSSYEHLSVPAEYAVQMMPYDTSSGEFRSHYAGFFDPGFGYGDGSTKGTPAVLEVRAHGDDFILRDRQPICKMVYSPVTRLPDKIYGVGNMGSNYVNQRGPRLSKYFRQMV
jgi:dCTP deaminase